MLPNEVSSEAERLQRCCGFAAEWQVTASGFWANVQFALGSAAAALAAVSSGTAFSDHSVVAGSLAAAAALAAAVLTSLRPAERAELHKQAAVAYHSLAVEIRLYRELGVTQGGDDLPPLDVLAGLEARAVELDGKSPWVPRRLAKKTEKFLRKGREYFDNDGREVTTAG
jgi:hypothetical protein